MNIYKDRDEQMISRIRNFLKTERMEQEFQQVLLASDNLRKTKSSDRRRVIDLLHQAFQLHFDEESQGGALRNLIDRYGYVRAAKQSHSFTALQDIFYYGPQVVQRVILDCRDRDSIGANTETLKRLKRFADEETAKQILSDEGFRSWLEGENLSRTKRRKIKNYLTVAFLVRFRALMVTDTNFRNLVEEVGYVDAIKQSELAELAEIEPFGEEVLRSVLESFRDKQSSQAAKTARQQRLDKNRQAGIRRVRRSDILRDRRSRKARQRNAAAKAKQKAKKTKRIAAVADDPYKLVLVSENYLRLEKQIFDPVVFGDRKPTSTGSMSFSLHLGLYAGGDLDGSEVNLTGGRYVGGLDLRIICRWDKRRAGQGSLTFKVKTKKVSRGECATWQRAQVRNVDHLPHNLQRLLWKALHQRQPHLVSAMAGNILQFAL